MGCDAAMMRGFGRVAHTIKAFLEQNGYAVHLGAWVDVLKGGRLVPDLQVGAPGGITPRESRDTIFH